MTDVNKFIKFYWDKNEVLKNSTLLRERGTLTDLTYYNLLYFNLLKFKSRALAKSFLIEIQEYPFLPI